MTWVGKVIVIQVLYGIVAIRGYFKFERVVFFLSVKLTIFLSACYSFLKGIVTTNRWSGVKMFLSVITAPIGDAM